MNPTRKILPALTILMIAIAVAVTGCNIDGATATNCSNGQCVTTHVSLNTSAPATTTQPAQQQSSSTYPTPTPQSESPSASVPGTSPTPDPSQAVATCFPQGVPARDTLVSFVNDQDNLGCLAIPPQTMRYFIRELLSYIFSAPPQTWQDQGDYQNWQQQQVVPLVQRCQQGQSS